MMLDFVDKWPLFHFFRINSFKIMGVFSNNKISQGQVAHDELFFTDKLVQVIQLMLVLFKCLGLDYFIVFIEE
jgi:hypothetical protein